MFTCFLLTSVTPFFVFLRVPKDHKHPRTDWSETPIPLFTQSLLFPHTTISGSFAQLHKPLQKLCCSCLLFEITSSWLHELDSAMFVAVGTVRSGPESRLVQQDGTRAQVSRHQARAETGEKQKQLFSKMKLEKSSQCSFSETFLRVNRRRQTKENFVSGEQEKYCQQNSLIDPKLAKISAIL